MGRKKKPKDPTAEELIPPGEYGSLEASFGMPPNFVRPTSVRWYVEVQLPWPHHPERVVLRKWLPEDDVDIQTIRIALTSIYNRHKAAIDTAPSADDVVMARAMADPSHDPDMDGLGTPDDDLDSVPVED